MNEEKRVVEASIICPEHTQELSRQELAWEFQSELWFEFDTTRTHWKIWVPQCFKHWHQCWGKDLAYYLEKFTGYRIVPEPGGLIFAKYKVKPIIRTIQSRYYLDRDLVKSGFYHVLRKRRREREKQEELVAKMLSWRRGCNEKSPSYTYFILSQDSKFMKIGKSVNVKSRFASLSTMSPTPLTLVGYVKGDIEAKLHSRFSHLRHHGEWFRYSHDLKRFVERKISEKKLENNS